MKPHLALLILLLLPLAFLGCGEANPDAPPTNSAHSSSWISSHPESALATANFADCTSCHASDLQGSDTVVSCYACHAFNTDTNFVIHPTAWTNSFIDHRGFASTNGTSSCANCHGATLLGSPAAPSCFSAAFDGLSCHADGPGAAPHPLDGTFVLPTNHGPVAKTDLTVCQACHAQAGGPGTNPRFNLGINSRGGTGCEACHGLNLAHPSPWAAQSHASAGNIAGACTLCHGVNLGGVADGGVGIDCFSCHSTSPAANPTGCASCHNQPPDALAPVGNLSPNRQGQHDRLLGGHSSLISDTPGLTCVRCHNGAGSGTANHFDNTNPADISFLHPDPSDTISAVSDGTNTTCNGACHVTNTFDITFPHTNATWY